MRNLTPSKIYKKISSTLLDKSFLSWISLSEELIERHLENVSFLTNLELIVTNHDYSCKSVLTLCKNLLYDVTKKEPPKDWIYYTYQFTLNKSFPEAVEIKLDEDLNKGAIIYLQILTIILDFEKKDINKSKTLKYPLVLLKEKEYKKFEGMYEYRKFKKIFNENYVYEMMKLHREVTGHNSIDHISGVHYVAMHIARQLNYFGLPIDLSRVSGAAAGHDIGKYGCKGKELKRVPYLHYYYTDLWFKKYNIPYIGHIATNHSTWDLELENLSIESLVLIYSDFRVKNRKTNGKKEMHIYSLEESFNIILNKLDNVDDAKEKRYRRVYAKLRDFENYMLDIGVSVDINKKTNPIQQRKHTSLMQNEEIIENIKYLSVNHNINLMHKLRTDSSLSSILELARSENDWKKLRGYLNILEEYSTHLTQSQKLITLNFLYDLLMNKEDDIRKQSAELMGILIATFDEEYRKEVPPDVTLKPSDTTSYDLLDKYINLMLYPDHKIIEGHRKWIGYSLRILILSLCSHCNKDQRKKYRDILLRYYEDPEDEDVQFYLLQTAKYIPSITLIDKSIESLYNFFIKMIQSESVNIRLSALERTHSLLFRINKEFSFTDKLREIFSNKVTKSPIAAENFLNYKIAKKLNLNKDILNKYLKFFKDDNDKTSDIFLKNLKSATNWVSKKIHIELLLDKIINNPDINGLHTAMHFCNLIKVSAIENVRNHAGDALVKMFPILPLDQRNDVTIELLRALEIQGYHFTKYIPYYLGQLILYLQPKELDELLDDFTDKIKHSNRQINFLVLKTIGIAIQFYPKYKILFKEEEDIYAKRQIKMLGILLNGLVSYDTQVRQKAFRIIGKEIFGSKELTLKQKNIIFKLVAKKILNLLPGIEENELLFLNNAASLNHIYRFISDYTFFQDKIKLDKNKKIAFFPGTFDPFSLGHKQIAKAIRDKGFEVYLAVDEFSWSKRTQPHILRRKIIEMSIADELNIYLYPQDIPINIANPDDLKNLKESFNHKDIHIVVGSDVILNASCYKIPKEEYSIHNFSHIIFERKKTYSSPDDNEELNKAITELNKNIVRLTLPTQYEDISSTQIRSNIDKNRDITELIDPLAQSYIYKYGIYRREPQYKSIIQTKSIDIKIIDDIDDSLINHLSENFFDDPNESFVKLKKLKSKLSPRFLIIRDINNHGKILGFSAFHWVRSSMLFKQFHDHNVSEYVREKAVGRIIVLDGVFIDDTSNINNLYQIVLTETLSFCLARDYNYAIYYNSLDEYSRPSLQETLKLQGFEQLPYGNKNNPVFVVSMSNPCTLNLDLESIIKEPFRNNKNVRKSILRSRKRLQRALTKLYPGQLILSFDRDVLYEKLVEKICETNDVPIIQSSPRKLGPYMCVPFGSILNGNIVPNTVTKSMHTEKRFTPDIEKFDIGPFPYYMSLKNQIRMIHSFSRSVILVDDLLNKGYRVKAIDPLIKEENIDVKKIIVGILSGRGKELMDIQDRDVDSAYFIPNLKVWFNENSLYPFIGGDTVWRGFYPERNLLPSVNFVLPYASPTFIKETSNEAIYQLSETCIKNSIDILGTIEKEYRETHERNLTLKHLGEAFISPRCPDHGKSIDYDLNLKASEYLKNDLEHLKRIESIIKK